MKINVQNIQTGAEKGLGLAIVGAALYGGVKGTQWCIAKARDRKAKRKAKKAAELAAAVANAAATGKKAE